MVRYGGRQWQSGFGSWKWLVEEFSHFKTVGDSVQYIGFFVGNLSSSDIIWFERKKLIRAACNSDFGIVEERIGVKRAFETRNMTGSLYCFQCHGGKRRCNIVVERDYKNSWSFRLSEHETPSLPVQRQRVILSFHKEAIW